MTRSIRRKSPSTTPSLRENYGPSFVVTRETQGKCGGLAWIRGFLLAMANFGFQPLGTSLGSGCEWMLFFFSLLPIQACGVVKSAGCCVCHARSSKERYTVSVSRT
eukprot:Rmarinus@m.24834